MSSPLQYDPSAALAAVPGHQLDTLNDALLAARQEVLDDVTLFDSGDPVPADKQPLDAGFIAWPECLLQDMKENGADSLIARIEQCAQRLRDQADSVVVLGIGGSYMGMRAMFEALLDPFHNELDRASRNNIPRLYFEGWNVDTDHQQALLDLLRRRATADSSDATEQRTAVIVISKSGSTLETAVAFRNFRTLLEEHFPEQVTELIVPVTGDRGRLKDLSDEAGFQDVFSIPDGIGGRFSVLTAVGLLPAAVCGINIRRLLQGAADQTEQFRSADLGSNPVMDYTRVSHLLEKQHGLTTRILSTWGSRLEAVGLWYDQLLSESLGKQEQGATPITGVNTRDLHSRGQQHQEGRRDKLITNLLPGTPQGNVAIPSRSDDHDQLNQFAGISLEEVLDAAIRGTNQAYAEDQRPTTDLTLNSIDDYSIGHLFQMLMLATVLEGRLIRINPYGQPGVEAYKRNMNAILKNR